MADIRFSAAVARVVTAAIVPGLARWTERQERRLNAESAPLEPIHREFADALGIPKPGRVRVAVVTKIPVPVPDGFVRIARRLGLPVFHPAAMALGNLVAVTRDEPALIRHELVHVAQYVRLGGHRPFLRRYVFECLRHGYRDAPLEIEARERSRKP